MIWTNWKEGLIKRSNIMVFPIDFEVVHALVSIVVYTAVHASAIRIVCRTGGLPQEIEGFIFVFSFHLFSFLFDFCFIQTIGYIHDRQKISSI